MHRRTCVVSLLLILISTLNQAWADNVLLLVDDVPSYGIVAANVNLTAAARWCGIEKVVPEGIRACSATDGKPVPAQFAPDAKFDGRNHCAGTLLLRLPPGTKAQVRLELQTPKAGESKPWDGTVTTPLFTTNHDAKRMGGLPWRFTFPKTKKVFDTLRWNDRVYHPDKGGFSLRDDSKPKVELVSWGPLATVVRVSARYMQGTKTPDSQPEAVYQWCYFNDLPLVWVNAEIRQSQPFAWREVHFLELSCQGNPFPNWVGGMPPRRGNFTGSKKSNSFTKWAALVEGTNAIGMFRCGRPTVYDGLGGFGNYLLAHGSASWQVWDTKEMERSAWMWIGSQQDPAKVIQAATKNLPCDALVTVTVDKVRAAIESARAEALKLKGPERRRAMLQVAGAEQLQLEGRFNKSAEAVAGQTPKDWTLLSGGDLGMILQKTDDGVRAAPTARYGHRHAATRAESPAVVLVETTQHQDQGRSPLGGRLRLEPDPSDTARTRGHRNTLATCQRQAAR